MTQQVDSLRLHRCRNILAKVPAGAQEEIRSAYWAIFDTAELTAASIQPGQPLVAAVQARIDSFAEKYCKLYPAAVRCLLSDCEQLTSYLRFPAEHHKRIRHSNFIERTFGETRRRVKVIGRLPGEASCLNLVWAVLDRASRGWRGLTTTSHGTRQLQDLRRSLLDPPTQIRRHNPAAASTPPDNVGAVA
jgi:putative transposase